MLRFISEISIGHSMNASAIRNLPLGLYLKKAGLASRNIVHVQKTFYVVSVLPLYSSFYL